MSIATGSIRARLERSPCVSSAPCRIDLGGTIDMKTIYLPMACLSPCTFNIAIDLPTRVTLHPYREGMVKVSSRGFRDAEFPAHEAPFDHPLGLMFAVASFFNADGIHIKIDSSSPPRSALGGSSAAAVALVAAMAKAGGVSGRFSKDDMAITAHAIEEGVALVPCGLQDQLAAAHGGVNAWYWMQPGGSGICFRRQQVLTEEQMDAFEPCFLVAYCGIPHESKNINGKWMRHFISASDRELWRYIITCTHNFIDALGKLDVERAAYWMNEELSARVKMTPDVLDEMGNRLVTLAVETGCGARFTGAGGGGCLWAIGTPENILALKEKWTNALKLRKDACLLDAGIDRQGVSVDIS